jgi:hypothetical protein
MLSLFFARFAVTLAPALSELNRLLLALPGDNVKVDFDTSLIERYAFIFYPVIALGTIGLIVVAVVSSLRSDDIGGTAKVEAKREVVTMLRREINGMTTEQLAKHIKLNAGKTTRLLEEMQTDGILYQCSMNRKKLWRVRGVGVT